MNRISNAARRMTRLGGAALLACAALAPDAQAARKQREPAAAPRAAGPQCNGADTTTERIMLPLGKSRLLQLPDAARSRSNGNPAVVQALLVAPRTLYVLGLDVGSTNMIVEGRNGRCVAYDFIVGLDPAGLRAMLAELMPDEPDIRVSAAADSLVLSGAVADAQAAERAVELATAFVRRPAEPLGGGAGKAGGETAATVATVATAATAARTRVINMLTVRAPQQVMLEVKVAEVSKSLLDRLDVATTLRHTSGSWTAALVSNFLSETSGGRLALQKSNGTQLVVDAQKQDGLVRILAEPNVMALSGQEGSFLAGGKILIPVGQESVSGGVRITLEEKEFGVGLKFTPTVLAGGRIHLRVAPEVSELSREGVGIFAPGTSARAVLPLITTRRAATTVQLQDGQSFAIGGLIKNNTVANVNGVPLLSEIPVLGALFRSTDFQSDRSELVFVVTPRLVKPLPPDYKLPTDAVGEPDRNALFLRGRLEGQAPPPVPAQGGFELK